MCPADSLTVKCKAPLVRLYVDHYASLQSEKVSYLFILGKQTNKNIKHKAEDDSDFSE